MSWTPKDLERALAREEARGQEQGRSQRRQQRQAPSQLRSGFDLEAALSRQERAQRRAPSQRQRPVPRCRGPRKNPLDWPTHEPRIVETHGRKYKLHGWLLAAEGFAGGGLLSLALQLEGIFVHDLCEKDEAAVESLKLNLHDYAVASSADTWLPDVPPGGLDLLTGGPPCQPFSIARHRGGGRSKTDNYFPRVLDWIEHARPRVVCLENVSRIVKEARFRNWFARHWWPKVHELGYEGTIWVLEASSFGTPQRRERAFVVLWPKGAPWGDALRDPPRPTHGRPGSPGVEEGWLVPWTRAFDRLNSGCCGGYGLSDCVNLGNVNGLCSTCVDSVHYEVAPNVQNPMGWEELKAIRQQGKVPEQAHGRMPLSELDIERSIGWHDPRRLRVQATRPVPGSTEMAWEQLKLDERWLTKYLSPAMVAGMAQSMAPSGLMEIDSTMPWPDVDRNDPESVERYVRQLVVMGARDAAKLMDVPMWYKFVGTRRQVFRQIGNGVPVNLGRAVARHIRQALRMEPVYPVPMGLRGPEEGLWPMDAVDVCARFTGILGYFGTTFGIPTAKQQLTVQQRVRRPHIDPAAYEQAMRQREVQEQRRPYWRMDYHDEPEYYRWNEIADWIPSSWRDHPPGFYDHFDFWDYAMGQGPELANHFTRAWMQGMGVSWQQAEAQLKLQTDPQAGYPDWSPYK